MTSPPIYNATLCMHGVLLGCKRLLRNICMPSASHMMAGEVERQERSQVHQRPNPNTSKQMQQEEGNGCKINHERDLKTCWAGARCHTASGTAPRAVRHRGP